jgi:two-component system sensor histidine kinase UhpB
VQAARDRLESWSKELEERVAERTREIARYSKMLTTRVLRAQEEERKRIARELHDDTAQSLSTLLINLDLIEPFVPADNSVLRTGFARVRTLVQRTLDEVRALSHDLRPTILDDFGLVAALHWYAEQLTETFRVPVTVQAETPPEGALTDEMVLALFRIAQEALMNAGKHAEATRAWVRLSFEEERATLAVEDNGRGFDIEEVRRPAQHGGMGLHGMRERAELIGAELTIESARGNDTRITVVVPLSRERRPNPDLAHPGDRGM